MTQDALVVGVDVGKDFLDVAFGPSGETWRVANDAEGRAELVRRLARLKLAVVAFEASGGYERPLLSALCRVGLPAARLNSFRVRKFGEALGIMAKNDRIDAGLIARFAATLPPRQTTTPDPAHEQLRELALVRRQLVDDRSRLQNQEEQTQNEMLQRFCRRRQATLAAQIVLIDKAIAQMIAEDADLARKDARLRSVPGIGLPWPRPCWRSCPSSDKLPGNRSQAWSGSPRSIMRAAAIRASASSLEDAHRYDEPSTWPPSSPPATTPCCARPMSV
jgi:transposase